jgi:hypothetical protein
MTLMLEYLLPFVCFLVGAAFCIDAINSHDAWSMGMHSSHSRPPF